MAWNPETLESRANVVARYLRSGDDPVLFGVECQLALVAHHLGAIRDRHQRNIRELAHTESRINTDIMRIQDVRYLHFLAKQRSVDNLKTKILNLDMERRRMQAVHDSDVQRLQDRLLVLLVEREHLKA